MPRGQLLGGADWSLPLAPQTSILARHLPLKRHPRNLDLTVEYFAHHELHELLTVRYRGVREIEFSDFSETWG